MKNNINNYVESNYSEFQKFLSDNFPIDSNKIPNNFYNVFLASIIPKIKNINDKSEHFNVVKNEFFFHFENDKIPEINQIIDFSNKLFDFNHQFYRDLKCEKLNKINSSIGVFLILLNVIFFILKLLLSNGYSLGFGFLFFSSLFWLFPILLGYIAYSKPVNSYFGFKQYCLLILNLIIVIIFIYLLITLII